MDPAQPPQLVRKISLHAQPGQDPRELLRREWLVTNGLGGYASGTISGSVTRRYHGLLVAALPAPLGRIVMFNHLAEFIHLPDGRTLQIGGEEPTRESDGDPFDPHYITEFRLENHLPVWRIEAEDVVIEKRILLVHGQNTVYIQYELLSGHESICLDLRPSFHFRGYEDDVATAMTDEYVMTIRGHCYELSSSGPVPTMRLLLHGDGGNFTHDGGSTRELTYQSESERGYRSRGLLWTAGYFSATLRPNQGVTLVGSTEDWPTVQALTPKELLDSEAQRRRRLIERAQLHAQTGPAAELVLAADQFIMTPAGRIEDAARARAVGDEIRSVIAGYHWFTDWGRDTMISLEGLTLSTGRHHEASWILRTFAHYVRDGLIPNYFPDGKNEGVYHTADATLWYFHAVDRYVQATSDRSTLRAAAADAARHRRPSPARHALRHRRRPQRRPAQARRRGLPAHLDGREGRRLGRHAAARQGGRDQCALVQRAAPARALDARGGGRGKSAPARRVRGESARVVQPALLV